MEVLSVLRVKVIDFGVFFGIADATSSANIVNVMVVVGTIGRAAQSIETTVRGGAMRSRCLFVV